MQSTQAHLRPVSAGTDLRPVPASEIREQEAVLTHHPPGRRSLSPLQCLGGFIVFLVWLALFGAGIMIDTAPYRSAISPEGARQLRAEGQPEGGNVRATQPAASGPVTDTGSTPVPRNAPAPAPVPGMLQSWLVVLFCFLPLNLAWLCVSASTLGAVGNLVNLGHDGDTPGPRDTNSPITSAILRGFFVYLFLMSGLLLLDHAPFSNAGPSQYIRLAGFLSLFSFVVSYHPHLFGALIQSAFERIQVRAGDNNGGAAATVQEHTAVRRLEIGSTSAASGPADAAGTGREEGS